MTNLTELRAELRDLDRLLAHTLLIRRTLLDGDGHVIRVLKPRLVRLPPPKKKRTQ